ncbi:hypothetical protein V496_03511, partial [Pseudogymnoascus sp. VKM F-4515 (FW-2607)]
FFPRPLRHTLIPLLHLDHQIRGLGCETGAPPDEARGKGRGVGPAIERRTKRHRVLRPPVPRAASNPIVEDITHHGPDTKVQPRRGRDPRQRPEEHGQVDVPHDARLAVPAVPPQRDGRDGADQETPDQGAVCGVGSEEFAGPDDAPEDGAVEVDAR